MAFHILAIPALLSAVIPVKFSEDGGNPYGRPLEPMTTAAADDMEMKPSPINPEWIVSGNPEARIAEHSQSADDAAMTAVWDCTAGTFRWYFGWDETVMILDGEVEVTDQNGQVRTLRKGDIAYFTGDTWATWKIDNYVRKVAFLRRPFPTPVALAIKLKAVLSRLKNGSAEPLRSAL